MSGANFAPVLEMSTRVGLEVPSAQKLLRFGLATFPPASLQAVIFLNRTDAFLKDQTRIKQNYKIQENLKFKKFKTEKRR